MGRAHTMIQYHSNINSVVGAMTTKLKALQENPDQMLRTVALAVMPELKKRVHVDGKASDGSPIGHYSKGYMAVRTGNYQNASTYKRGANKGKAKENKKAGEAGGFTSRAGESKAGKPRPVYNRSGDPKVILSLTRQMENDLSVLPSGGGYGIGFNNADNFKKSQYNELTYKKAIWSLTTEEKDLAVHTANGFVNEFLNSK